MITRPRVLNSDWYLYEIYDTIPRALKGAQEWFRLSIPSEQDRREFDITMQACREMCAKPENRYDAIAMKESLVVLRDMVQSELDKPSWSFIKLKSWYADRVAYRLKAIDLCVELVDGITKKYLMHS